MTLYKLGPKCDDVVFLVTLYSLTFVVEDTILARDFYLFLF